MNKTVEYPYEGCYPEQEGGFKVWFLVMMILLFTPLLSLVVQEKILFHWGYIIGIYPIGVLVWWFGWEKGQRFGRVSINRKRQQ